jgi:hypothetical protein
MGMRNKICPVPWQHMEIGYNHDVFLCCHIPTPVGNLGEDRYSASLSKIEEIWKGEKAEEIRSSILDRSYRFCDANTCPILDQPVETTPYEWWHTSLAIYPQDIVKARPNWTVSIAPWPLRISLANDKSCNLACESCRNDRLLDDANPKLDIALRRLLNAGVLEFAEVLKLNGSGEFVHSKKLLAFVAEVLVRYPRLRLELLTNMTTFDAEMFYRLGFRHRVSQIWGSIDAATPATYAKVRGGNFKAVLRHLDSFANIRGDEGIRLIMGFVVSSRNFREMGAFAKLADDRGIGAHFMGIQNWGHLRREVYDELDVARKTHPAHTELVELINADPILKKPHVKLGNFLRLLTE